MSKIRFRIKIEGNENAKQKRNEKKNRRKKKTQRQMRKITREILMGLKIWVERIYIYAHTRLYNIAKQISRL